MLEDMYPEMHKAEADGIKHHLIAPSCWTFDKTATDLINNTEVTSATVKSIRLPFDAMFIDCPDPDPEDDLTLAPVDFGLLVNEIVIDDDADPGTGTNGEAVFVIDEPNAFQIIAMFPGNGGVGVLQYCIVLPYADLDRIDEWHTKEKGKYGINWAYDSTEIGPSVRELTPGYIFDNEEHLSDMQAIMGSLLLFLIKSMVILSCINADIKELPTPKYANRKRKKQKLYEHPMYRTLHLKGVKSNNTRGGLEPKGLEPTKASPRVHWTRGHIKNVPTKKGYIRKWIKPYISGGKGKGPDGHNEPTPLLPEVVLEK